jgi:hypothetical protein
VAFALFHIAFTAMVFDVLQSSIDPKIVKQQRLGYFRGDHLRNHEMNDQERLSAAISAYFDAFHVVPLEPFGINARRRAEVLEQAVADGTPVPCEFDWWAHLPPGAVA